MCTGWAAVKGGKPAGESDWHPRILRESSFILVFPLDKGIRSCIVVGMVTDPITLTLSFLFCIGLAFVIGVWLGRRVAWATQPDQITNISLSLPADAAKVGELTPLDPQLVSSDARARLWYQVYDRTFAWENAEDAMEAANEAVETAFGRLPSP